MTNSKLYTAIIGEVFFFIYLYPNNNNRPTKKGVFFYLCPNLDKRPPTKCVFSIYALTKHIKQREFYYIFALALTKANQKVCLLIFVLNVTKALQYKVSFSSFALTLAKGQPHRVSCLSLFLPYPNQRPTTQIVFLHFCPKCNHTNHKVFFFSIFSLPLPNT